MSVSPAIVLQLAIIVYGLLFVILGAIFAYLGLLGINGKFKPGGWEGIRFNFSKNYKLFNQDKYWYDINRYGGKMTVYLAILVALLGMAIIVLPVDPQLKMYIGMGILWLFMPVGFIVVGVQTYRYANRLITQ